MYKIYKLDDLIQLGQLAKGVLFLNGGGLIKFMEPIQIPFGIKFHGDTTLSATVNVDVNFTTARPVFTSSARTNAIGFRGINIHAEGPLFDIKPNTAERILLESSTFNCPSLGEATFRDIHLLRVKFLNKEQYPLTINSCDSITAMHSQSHSSYPLFEISEEKQIRNFILTHKWEDLGKGGLLSVGTCDSDNIVNMAKIPERSIMARLAAESPINHLRVVGVGEEYRIPPREAVQKYFA